MKSFLIAITMLLGTFATAHVGHNHPPMAGHLVFKNGSVHVHATFTNAPAVGVEAPLVLETKEAVTHQNISLEDSVEVVLWMPSMGHGSAPTQIQRVLDSNGDLMTGVYQVRNVYFTMGGDWEVRVVLTNAQGQKETKSFNIKLDGSGHGGGHN
jgi:hypothetical protein